MKITKSTLTGWILITALTGIVMYSYRYILLKQFDHQYFKHFYDHSQWSIPESPRVMGDGELYQYAGFALVNGADPFSVNPEVPLVGKYMYGLAINYFSNAYAFNFALYIVAILTFYWLVRLFKLDYQGELMAMVIFVSSPLIFNQIGDTALDLLYLVLMMNFLIQIEKIKPGRVDQRQMMHVVLAGVFLGLFVGVKFAIFSLPLITFTLTALRFKGWGKIATIGIIAGAIYTLTYAAFFSTGHSFFEWLEAQKWMVNFYTSSTVPKNPLLFWTTSLFGVFKSGQTWERVAEWNIVWSLGLAILIYAKVKKIVVLPKSMENYAVTLIALYCIVPFAVRYILLLLPLLIIMVAHFAQKWSFKWQVVMIGLVVCQAVIYTMNSPERTINRLNQLLANERFDELYEEIKQPSTSRAAFSRPIHTFIETIEAKEVDCEITKNSSERPRIGVKTIRFFCQYNTSIGQIRFEKNGTLENENGKWKLVWDWEYIAPYYKPEAEVLFIKENQVGGNLVTADDKTLSKGSLVNQIALIPQEIENEAVLLDEVGKLTGVDPLKSRIMIHVDHPPDVPKTIAFTKPGYDPYLLDKIASSPGVIVRRNNAMDSRVYPQGAIDNKLVPQIKEIEMSHKELTQYIQGKLLIDGHEVYSSPKATPSDVKLPLTLTQIFGPIAEPLF